LDIKSVKIIDNRNVKSISAKKMVREAMMKYGFIENHNNADLVIAIGGDGAFINALKNTHFNRKSLYVGIHTGHLGFLQEVKVEEIDLLFKTILDGVYKVETLSIEQIEVIGEESVQTYYALNEMVLREQKLKTIKLDVSINERHLQKFAGDGIVISTPTGSTAYNNSLGGSIIYPSLHTLQVLPLAPLPITRHYASLKNSVIVPENMTISIIPEVEYQRKIHLCVDGQDLEFSYVEKINITSAKEGINVLRFNNYDFWERINSKFLKLED
jgi:Predicted sugar kinase